MGNCSLPASSGCQSARVVVSERSTRGDQNGASVAGMGVVDAECDGQTVLAGTTAKDRAAQRQECVSQLSGWVPDGVFDGTAMQASVTAHIGDTRNIIPGSCVAGISSNCLSAGTVAARV